MARLSATTLEHRKSPRCSSRPWQVRQSPGFESNGILQVWALDCSMRVPERNIGRPRDLSNDRETKRLRSGRKSRDWHEAC